MGDEFKQSKFFTPITIINVVLFLVTIFSGFYFLYFKKDFNFIIEVPCDPSKEECIARDCSIPDLCPPNNLELLKRYELLASDFAKCPNENCLLSCEEKSILCRKIDCVIDEEAGEQCTSPNLSNF